MMVNNIPANTQAERAAVGACLLSTEALGVVSEILSPEDFYDANNKIMYEICLSMYHDGKPVDLVTFQSEAINRNVFERIGGQPFLAELVSDTMAAANAGYYAEIVKTLAIRRGFVEAGPKISALGMKSDLTPDEIVSEAEKVILGASSHKGTAEPVAVQASLPTVLGKINELKTGARKNTGYLSKFADLDKIVGGFQPGTLNIIAARPSMGKTALALNIAQFGSNSEGGNHVLFFSL